jgi:RNA polymerase sigma-54 factor
MFLHESTVGRAISGKSISTPRGIFELKELLPREIKTAANEDYSAKVSDYSVKEYIRELFKNEPQDAPYSDNCVADFLNVRGIKISRRCVSKYRENLDIPNSSERGKIYEATTNA